MLNAEKFNKNLSKYNSNAILQKNIAKELIKIILSNVGKNFDNIFEIGCGSGFLTKNIYDNLNYKNLILNDIVENSRIYTDKFSKNFILGNIENIKFPTDINLAISSSVFQWLNDFNSFAEKVCNSLATGGIFAFSMFINNNFREINSFFNISLNYLKNETILNILRKNFDILYCAEKEIILDFKNPIELLQHIKNTGVNVINKEKLTKAKIYDFINDNVLNLTYDYNFIIARKK